MTIRTGIGGWTYPDWRAGAFYPVGLRQADEQAFATRAVQVIEVNGTFYRRQAPASFAAWRKIAPPGFVYAIKGSRFVTNRKVLATAEQGLANFFDQGLVELCDMLGPIVWQMAATKRFEPDDVAAFFAMLPASHNGVPLRHAIEAGHESFACAEFVALARKAGVAVVYLEAAGAATIADRTADFAYARMKSMQADCLTGYPTQDLDRIAGLCRAWSVGQAPEGLPYHGDHAESVGRAGDVFALMINGAKVRAPAAAIALASRLGDER